jgi:Pregnancy-associated plasma protein-A/GEVED domain
MTSKKIFFLIYVILFNSIQIFAQKKCAADELRNKLFAENPSYKLLQEEMDKGLKKYIEEHPIQPQQTDGTEAAIYFIPCVVHVIYDGAPNASLPSSSQITGAINYINSVFDATWTGTGGAILGAGDLQIKLVLATKDPNNNTTTGIVRVNGAGLANYSANGVNAAGTTGASEISVKNLSRWDPEKYYNIWIVSKIDGCTGFFCGCSCDAGYIAGYAYFPLPNNTSSGNMNLDGTMMLASLMVAGEKTLPHEIGHALNLYHPFQGNGGTNICPVNTVPATDGDQCPDTQPVTNPQIAISPFTAFSCRAGSNPCTGAAYNDNTEKNYMNYTNCYQLFTNDQKARMQASCNVTQRASLATSWANNEGTYPAPFVQPIAAASTPSSTLTSAELAGILNVSLNGKNVYSLNATQDAGYLNNSTKWYNAFVVTANTTYTLNVTILDNANRSQLGVWIDYNNDGIFNNTTEQIFLNTDIVASTAGGIKTIPISFTTPIGWPGRSNFVRFRLSQDLSTVFGIAPVTSTSSTLAYGQAEDYPIYLSGGLLPVTLINFDGKKANDAIQLRWNTSTEINTASFDIERSYKSSAFNTIGSVTALNASGGASYNYIDNNVPNAGEYMYRLKMKDFNGSFAYSDVIKFTILEKKKMLVLSNPVHENIYVELPSNTGTGIFRLIDATGRIIFTINIKLNGTLYATIPINGIQLASGMYVLEAIINGERYTQKIVKK